MRHPKLRIAFSHGGGVMSILLPRLVHAWNVSPKAKESLAESPAVTAKRFYYDELVFDPSAVRFVMRDLRRDARSCIGTDYPYAMGDFCADCRARERARSRRSRRSRGDQCSEREALSRDWF